MKANSKVPATVDEYLNALPGKVRDSLQSIRKTTKAAAPKAEELISYGIPTFKYKGMLISYAAFKNHCSFFGGHGIIKTFSKELKDYDIKGATIRFPPDKPLPATLVKKMIKARIKENEAKLASKAAKK